MTTTRKMASQALELRDELNNSDKSEEMSTATLKGADLITRSSSKSHANDNNNWDQTKENGENEEKQNNDKKSSSVSSKVESTQEDGSAPLYKCPICGIISITQHDFTEHIRGHNNTDGSQNYTCQICFKVVSSASSLDRHVLVHTGERPFTCKYCHVTFTTNGNMHRHMRTHKHRDGLHTPNESENNSEGNSEASNAKSHETYESDGSSDSHRSDTANYHFREGKRKIQHDDNITNNFKRRLKTINNNNFKSVESAMSGSGQRFCCPVCVRNDFHNMASLENHVDKEHPSIQAKCRYCEVVFKSYKLLNAHKCSLSQKTPFITQGFKDLTFVDFSSEKFPLIARSMCEQGIRTPITNQKYECPFCYRAFPCTTAVELHMKSCGSLHTEQTKESSMLEKSLNDNLDERTKRDIFFAHLDLKNTNENIKELNANIPMFDVNNEDRLKQSSQIKKEFLLQQMQPIDTKDLADIHSIIKNASCSSSFLQQLDKPSSMLSASSLEFSREEEEAQDAFTAEFRKMKLRGEFPCKLCTAVFPNLRALKGHNRIHLSSAGSGPYYCNMCPYFIHDKAALVRHMRTHNGDRPYECAICNYAFTTKANCERHLRNRHGKTTRDEVKRAIIYHPSEDSSCDDPIKKMQMYNASYDDDEEDEKYSKDLSTIGSINDDATEKPAKIQVKSIEQLIQQQNTKNSMNADSYDAEAADLSMNALDLSKTKNVSSNEDNDDRTSVTDETILDQNQRLLLAQQQFLNEMFPQLDPTHYLQLTQLYRNLVFPSAGFPLHPLFHPLLSQLSTKPNLNKAKNDASAPSQVFPGGVLMNPMFPEPNDLTQPNLIHNLMQSTLKCQNPSQNLASSLMPQMPPVSQPQASHISQQATMMQSQANQNNAPQMPGPIKMVIKNGVLMPKQKQRRYRTERPFACEHCSARFTLRSNMERHIKQQHPQYWAQRQRSGANAIRKNIPNVSSTSPVQNTQATSIVSSAQKDNAFPLFQAIHSITDQAKYSNLFNTMMRNQSFDATKKDQLKEASIKSPAAHDDEYDENHDNDDDDDDDDDNDDDSVHTDREPKLVIAEDISGPEDLSSKTTGQLNRSETENSFNSVVKNLLDKAMESSRLNNSLNISLSPVSAVTAQSTPLSSKVSSSIKHSSSFNKAQYDPALKIFKDITDSGFGASPSSSTLKEDGDLVSVSKLVDNATNILSFGKYFRNDVLPNEQSDEEGLVASGSASESNSGTEEPNSTTAQSKKKSAYSLAPNRVSCPYCQRMFPWSSSLRRHILTHTGQKPFKCSHCPLLFTTKSNCDRHLLRKHGDVESAVSLYVPIDEIQTPPSTAVIEKQPVQLSPVAPPAQLNPLQVKTETAPSLSNADQPFKCHLCDGSFPDRVNCLDHIKIHHPQDFALLLSKSAIETDPDSQIISAEDEEKNADYTARGKYPDYTNRKVVCAFCMRRFWSTEDLRRHMRTHSGERPFQCEICMRKFTLKHSMLRHQKKHKHQTNQHANNSANSASDLSDDDQSVSMPTSSKIDMAITETPPSALAMKLINVPNPITESILKWKQRMESIESGNSRKSSGNNDNNPGENEESSELIGNLLGISDSSILNKVLLSSADEAAKLLGVDK